MIKAHGWEPTILLVEDDALTSEQLGELLQEGSRQVLRAVNAEQGLRMYKETRPDIVITDILMPGMNGLEMAREIRKLDPSVPIIVITAYSETDDFEAARELLYNLILKPVDIGALQDTVSRCREKVLAQRGPNTGP
jgi:YesN/AraC family two-component response regulator